jgi:hypothetical protein
LAPAISCRSSLSAHSPSLFLGSQILPRISPAVKRYCMLSKLDIKN